MHDALSRGKFSDSLKLANITPVDRKDKATDKENYRPVSVLPLFWKIFERIIYDHHSPHLEKYLVYYAVFGKVISHNILCCNYYKHVREWDKYGFFGTILMDISKVYDSLPHDLLVAKFEAYGIGKNELNLHN